MVAVRTESMKGAKSDFRNESSHVRYGSKADIGGCNWHVRFTPNSGHQRLRLRCPLSANRRHSHRSKLHRYSITASALCWRCIGTSRPSALAVLRLIARSNLTGAWTGSSPGLAPLRMRST